MTGDREESPRPLRDPCAPRRAGSSLDGYYGNDRGKDFRTASAKAEMSEEDTMGVQEALADMGALVCSKTPKCHR